MGRQNPEARHLAFGSLRSAKQYFDNLFFFYKKKKKDRLD